MAIRSGRSKIYKAILIAVMILIIVTITYILDIRSISITSLGNITDKCAILSKEACRLSCRPFYGSSSCGPMRKSPKDPTMIEEFVRGRGRVSTSLSYEESIGMACTMDNAYQGCGSKSE